MSAVRNLLRPILRIRRSVLWGLLVVLVLSLLVTLVWLAGRYENSEIENRLERDGMGIGYFTLQCVTGYLDKSDGFWFGLISILRDPQMLVNKTFPTDYDPTIEVGSTCT